MGFSDEEEEIESCEACGEEMDHDCDGDPHCSTCDGPCLHCHNGDGPSIHDEAEGAGLWRVSYFSMWSDPQHMENLTYEEHENLVRDGKDRQFKVVVTLMTEDAPTTWT